MDIVKRPLWLDAMVDCFTFPSIEIGLSGSSKKDVGESQV
jgi:hypothetical protein